MLSSEKASINSTTSWSLQDLEANLKELEEVCGVPLTQGEKDSMQELDWWLGGVTVSAIRYAHYLSFLQSWQLIKAQIQTIPGTVDASEFVIFVK